MKIRPSAVYRNLFFIMGTFIVFYTVYHVLAYDGGSHDEVHRRQKHLYLTVSKDRIGHRFEKLAPKRILMWTTVFGEAKSVDLSDCKGFSDRCIVTSNKSLVSVADAVVFHAQDIPNAPLPEADLRRPHQRYVFLSMETPANSGRHAVPLNFFNWTATYLLSSDVIFKYGPFYLSAKEAELKGFKFVDFHIDESALVKKKSGIFGLVSNCKTLSKRELALKELSRYINVTIGGKCAMNKYDVDLCPVGKSCSELYGQYPFYLAVENSVCKDYITEKYWDRTSIPSIPIVMRRKIYESSNMPPHSFIAMDDYSSPREMAEHLLRLESDKKAYAEYFAWRKGSWTVAPWNAPGYRNGFCRLCERLWEEDPQSKVRGEYCIMHLSSLISNPFSKFTKLPSAMSHAHFWCCEYRACEVIFLHFDLISTNSNIEDVWAWFDAEAQCEKDDFVKSWIRK
ncbi:hypothetical protein Y032_0253g254 [Ancylostoma ceylanicum]|uniref:Fucosyltransferase n=2 Tax=Ancylostoma ceylanicum TaxID=53326 RepID=A0A016SBG7_9BILA|nr:hypothetical protein Y032_0253g254 [Ancylostoma ceylanicum]